MLFIFTLINPPSCPTPTPLLSHESKNYKAHFLPFFCSLLILGEKLKTDGDRMIQTMRYRQGDTDRQFETGRYRQGEKDREIQTWRNSWGDRDRKIQTEIYRHEYADRDIQTWR